MGLLHLLLVVITLSWPVSSQGRIGECGERKIPIGRIFSGTTAVRGAWPWQVLLLQDNHPICGGALIDRLWVLTAAHCIPENPAKSYQLWVRLGEHDRDVSEGTELQLSVMETIIHPKYNRNVLDFDAALLRLVRPVVYNSYIQPVCLPRQDEQVEPKTSCMFAGWGRYTLDSSMVPVLQQLPMFTADSERCEIQNSIMLRTNTKILDSMLCATAKPETHATVCKGDSGGPLVCRINSHYVLQGLLSWGPSNCKREGYSVFSRVTEFSDWTRSHLERTMKGR